MHAATSGPALLHLFTPTWTRGGPHTSNPPRLPRARCAATPPHPGRGSLTG